MPLPQKSAQSAPPRLGKAIVSSNVTFFFARELAKEVENAGENDLTASAGQHRRTVVKPRDFFFVLLDHDVAVTGGGRGEVGAYR